MSYTLVLMMLLVGSGTNVPNVAIHTQKINNFTSLKACNAAGIKAMQSFQGFFESPGRGGAQLYSKFSCFQLGNPEEK